MIGFAILLGTQWACEVICRMLHLRFPGSVLGMVVLAIALVRGWISAERISGAAGFLQKNMILFFLPAGVACIDYLGLIGDHFVEIILSSAVSTVIVMLVAGLICDKESTT